MSADENLLYLQSNVVILISIIKTTFIFLCTYFTNFKIVNKNIEFSLMKMHKFIFLLIIGILCGIVKCEINYSMSIAMITVVISLIFARNEFSKSLLVTTLSLSINYFFSLISIIVCFILNKIIGIYNDYLNLAIMMGCHIFLLKSLFRIKRFKYGILHWKNNTENDYIDYILLNVCVVILFSINILENSDIRLIKNLTVCVILFSMIMFVIIQKSFQLYYKQKLLIQDLTETKKELTDKIAEITNLEKENLEASKKRHTLVHKQNY